MSSARWIALIETIILYGAISGAVYALLALGFTLIYGMTRVVNLAHGSFYMLGAYLFYVFGELILHEAHPFVALLFAVVSVGIVGGIVYRLTIHPVLGDEVAVMVVTIGLALIFQQLMLLIFGSQNVSVEPLVEEVSVIVWGVSLSYPRILVFAVSLVLFVCLVIFIMKMKIGKAMRAVSQDREAAMLMGINTERLYILTMVISSALAAVAGIFVAASTIRVAATWMWFYPLALSFSIVVLGGLGSIKGSLIGAFIIGYAEQTVAIAVPEGGAIITVVPFTIMVLLLLLRPKGLFGKRVEMEE